jgi:uncharacterized protein YjbI with pentapeptide repeats
LEEEILALVEAGATGKVGIFGPPGSGKTTALAHLAAVLPPDAGCVFRDEPAPALEMGNVDHGLCIIAARSSEKLGVLHAGFTLSAWSRDDVIEYLLAEYPKKCASVVSRLSPNDLPFLGGSPQLCQIVCEEFVRDESLRDAATALRRHVARQFSDEPLVERIRDACLASLAEKNPMYLLCAALPPESHRLLRHHLVQVLLAAEGLAASLRTTKAPKHLGANLPRELVRRAAELVREDRRSLNRLQRLLSGSRDHQPMAASILNYAAALPSAFCRSVKLRGAYLDGVNLPRVRLIRADLIKADLSGADLQGADLSNSVLDDANLAGAKLRGARLQRVCAYRADLSQADLSATLAEVACFNAADLTAARFDRADLPCASFSGANLERASFAYANLSRATFPYALLAGADFTGAKLDGAKMASLRLREAEFRGASLMGADLTQCDLENVEAPRANFSYADLRGAALSGSIMRGADFSYADLRNSGLAEIDWQGASLRKTDLRGATFHMGGSRSGLVGSPIASEGSRTGFYTDEFEEQHFKSPEEIRKANLCGVDLRGALIDGVDFYLVDLRGAKYDPDQEQQLRRSGAILEARV